MPGTEGQHSPVFQDIEPGDPSPMDISNSFHPGVFPEPIPIDNNVADSYATFDPGHFSHCAINMMDISYFRQLIN
jgi:hypothetical protein